jgi:hypothetical protein
MACNHIALAMTNVAWPPASNSSTVPRTAHPNRPDRWHARFGPVALACLLSFDERANFVKAQPRQDPEQTAKRALRLFPTGSGGR